MLKEPKVGIDACAQRFCAQAFEFCDSGNGTCPQVRMSKADVVIDIRSVVCVCRLTDPIQSLGDPVWDLQVGP